MQTGPRHGLLDVSKPVGTLELVRRIIMTARKRLHDMSLNEDLLVNDLLTTGPAETGSIQQLADLAATNQLAGMPDDLLAEEAYMAANSGNSRSFVEQEIYGTHQASRAEYQGYADGSATDLINDRLGEYANLLTQTQFQEVVAMYLSGNNWLTNSHYNMRVVDDGTNRMLYVNTDDRLDVCPVSWTLVPHDYSRYYAKKELARQDANYKPNRYQTPTDEARLDLIQAEMVKELADDFQADDSEFRLDPCYARPLPFPAVRTYNSHVLNFNGPMVAAVRAQHDGVMPRYAGIMLHATKAQLAIKFSTTYVPGYHLVSPESDYNSYRVHAGSSVHNVFRKLREVDSFGTTQAEYESISQHLNGRRRCHSVKGLWIVDYTEEKQ